MRGLDPEHSLAKQRASGHLLRLASVVCLFLLCGCGLVPTPPSGLDPAAVVSSPEASDAPAGDLSQAERRTLSSLRLVNPYPLYTLDYVSPYEAETAGAELPTRRWSCSLFAALGDPSSRLAGRNFDWEFSPALLLFTDPPEGYASVSMVDIAYLLAEPSEAGSLLERPLDDRRELLRAPHLPFDGMNEHGLVVGMAAVPEGDAPFDPSLPTVDDLELIRWMLDQARTVEEAVGVMRGANITWGSGPPIHYLIADATGDSVLVEYVDGEIRIVPNASPWHLATNFFVSGSGQEPYAPAGICPRYDRMLTTLSSKGGVLRLPEALDLLRGVSTPTTQWSVVYDISQRRVHVAMGGDFEVVHTFDLRP